MNTTYIQALLDAKFSLNGVPEAFREIAMNVTSKILAAGEADTLQFLHAGWGRRIDLVTLKVEDIYALNHGMYSGTYTLKADSYPEIGVGEEAWVILYGIDHEGETQGAMHLFPVQVETDPKKILLEMFLTGT